jgi:hypothetical protein
VNEPHTSDYVAHGHLVRPLLRDGNPRRNHTRLYIES